MNTELLEIRDQSESTRLSMDQACSINKLYWPGNAAKTKIIGDLLRKIQHKNVVIFDYGCGNGGDWPSILADYPNIQLIGYDISTKSIQIAESRLSGFNATLLTGDALYEQNFKADFIVSLSVLEHVYDRKFYLNTAKKHLKEDGYFYLNYDDGHFRNLLDLNEPRLWLWQIHGWLINLPSLIFGGLNKDNFQMRVSRSMIDKLIAECGFEIDEVFYGNLMDFKSLYKTLPESSREDYINFWLNVEDTLNRKFLFNQKKSNPLSDTCNLWQFMGSRTLVLRIEQL